MTCRKLSVIFLFSLFAVIFPGCYGEQETQEENDTIYIGIAWTHGQNNFFIEGAELAASEANEAGGVLNKKIKLLINENELKTYSLLSKIPSVMMAGDKIKEPSREVANYFIKSPHKISAVIGHRFSYMAISAAVLYHQAKLLFIAPTATSEMLTSMNLDNVFRLLAKNSVQGEQIALYSAAKKIRRAVVFCERSEAQFELYRAFKQIAARNGISIVFKYSFFGIDGIDDLSSYVVEVKGIHKKAPVDAVFIFAGDNKSAHIIHEFCERDLSNVNFITGDSANTDTFWKEIENIQSEHINKLQISTPSVFNRHSNNVGIKKFVEKFSEIYHRKPDYRAALGYDAINILRLAIERAKSVESAKIATEIRYMPACRGMTGTISFNEKGDPVKKSYMMKVSTLEGFEYHDISGDTITTSPEDIKNLPECASLLKNTRMTTNREDEFISSELKIESTR